MEKNKVIKDEWVRPEYKPMPEFKPTDLSTINFDKYFKHNTEPVRISIPTTEATAKSTSTLKSILSKFTLPVTGFHGIFALMYGEDE